MNEKIDVLEYDALTKKDAGLAVRIPRGENGFSFAVITEVIEEGEQVLVYDPFNEEAGSFTWAQVKFTTPEDLTQISKLKNAEVGAVLQEWRFNNADKIKTPAEPKSEFEEKLGTCITSNAPPRRIWNRSIQVAMNQAKEYWRPSHPWMKGVTDEIFAKQVLLSLAFDDKGDLRFTEKWGEHIKQVAPGVWRFPLFSPEYCQWLVKTAKEKNFWQKERGDAYAAMETRLACISPWLDVTHTEVIAGHFINQICSAIFENWLIKQCEEPFIINYCKAIDTIHTHCDGDSTLTMLVHLHGGGGTHFPNINYTADGLKEGEAILFCGGSPLYEHRSLPSDDRQVLVYWMN